MAGVAGGPVVGHFIDRLVPWYASLFAISMLLCFQAIQTAAGGINSKAVGAVVVATFGLDIFRQMLQVSLTTAVFGISVAARARLNAVLILSVSFLLVSWYCAHVLTVSCIFVIFIIVICRRCVEFLYRRTPTTSDPYTCTTRRTLMFTHRAELWHRVLTKPASTHLVFRCSLGRAVQIFIGQVMGTSVGTNIFVHHGWRASALFSMGLYGFQLFILLIRGPHVRQYTWFGWEGGWESRKKVVEARKREREEREREKTGAVAAPEPETEEKKEEKSDGSPRLSMEKVEREASSESGGEGTGPRSSIQKKDD